MIRKPVSTDGLTSLGAIAKLGYPAEALKRMRILRDEGRAARLQLPPMTPAQIEAEAAYAEKVYKELVLNPTPETKRKISEAIKLRRPSRSQSL